MTTVNRSNRDGLGALTLVICLFFAVIVPVGLARHLQNGQARNGCQAAVLGSVAADLARSALEEAAGTLARLANDPASGIYRSLRAGRLGSVTVPVPVPLAAGEIRADPLLKGFEIEGGQVTATLAETTSMNGLSYEWQGTWRLTAHVRHPGAGITRTVSEDRTFKVALLSIPRPYDQFTVSILDAHPLVGAEINRWLDESHDALVDLAGREIGELATRLAAAGADPDLARQLRVPVPPTISDPEGPAPHHVGASYVIADEASSIANLRRLRLLPVIEPLRRAIEVERASYESAKGAALAARGPAAARAARRAGEALERLAAAHALLIAEVTRHQTYWHEMHGAAADRYLSFRSKLDVNEWHRRAFLEFKGPGAAQRFLDFLREYERDPARAPINGVIFVDNAGEPLRLRDARLHGKLAVLATGDVELADVTLADPANDLFVLQCERTLAVRGRVHAGLIARGRFDSRPDVKLSGSLVLDHLDDPDALAGSIHNEEERYGTGYSGAARLDRQYVAQAPYASWSSLDRR